MTASCTANEKIKTSFTQNYKLTEKPEKLDKPEENTPFKNDGVECHKVIISRSTEVAGSTQTLYYSVNDIKIKGWPIKHALIKIVEPAGKGNVVYSLKNITIE